MVSNKGTARKRFPYYIMVGPSCKEDLAYFRTYILPQR